MPEAKMEFGYHPPSGDRGFEVIRTPRVSVRPPQRARHRVAELRLLVDFGPFLL